jgi:mono/diheme cytochrome c family protein
MTARRLSTVSLLLAASIAAAQKPSPADLAVQSRAILAKHCSQCHGGKASRSTLNILDYPQLVKDRPVQFVRSKEPTASQMLELIEEGSMPPGTHAKLSEADIGILRNWVANGAVAYPIRFDDEFAYATILADVTDAGPDKAAGYRYLTLHHIAANAPVADLTKARNEFRDAVESVVKVNGAIKAIDSTDTVFRLDLEKAGWHHRPFKKLDDKGEDAGPADGNLYDVVLLEYSLGIVPQNSPIFEKLGTVFLKPARLARPFAFVRGDWFARTATASPLADDLRELIKLYEQVPAGLERPRAASEVTAKVEASAIPAVDAWHGGDPPGPPSVKGFSVQTLGLDNKPRSRFRPNDRFKLRVTAEEPMHFQYLWVNSSGQIDKHSQVVAFDPAQGPKDIVLPPEGGLGDESGRERLIVFGSPTAFPSAEVWRSRHQTKVIERFVHPFFPLKRQGDGLVPDMSDAKVSRRTVQIEIVKSEKK